MNKRQSKKMKKKELNKPMLALREGGMLGGYTCPRCGRRHVKEPYCRTCNQMLIYDESQRNSAPLWKSNIEWEKNSRQAYSKYETENQGSAYMGLTETEREVVSYLRNSTYRTVRSKQGCHSPVEDLSDEEIVSLYNKMDSVIQAEGELRRGVGSLDEMYVLGLLRVKDTLAKECSNRGIDTLSGQK